MFVLPEKLSIKITLETQIRFPLLGGITFI
jgi:hypothetical protein